MHKLGRYDIQILWTEKRSLVETEYMQAAVKLANHVASAKLEGIPDAIYLAEFQCAVHKRNTMLGAVAKMLLDQANNDVKGTMTYQNYAEGMITATECIDTLVN